MIDTIERSTTTDTATVTILIAGDAIGDLASIEIRACACECACDESCYSCNDCSDEPDCAC